MSGTTIGAVAIALFSISAPVLRNPVLIVVPGPALAGLCDGLLALNMKELCQPVRQSV